jgi:hypothetical protein
MTISIINYVLLGFQFTIDGFFMHSFEVFLATTVVFWGSGTLGYTLLEYRLGHKKLVSRACGLLHLSFLTSSTYPLHAFDIYICGRMVNLCRFHLLRSMRSLRTSCGYHSCAYLFSARLTCIVIPSLLPMTLFILFLLTASFSLEVYRSQSLRRS